MSDRWRRNLSDAAWLFVVPLAAALMPWRFGFRLLRAVAARGYGFGDIVEAAWSQAGARWPELDRAAFAREMRLTLLVDRCDSYLTWLRSARWWRARIDVDPGVEALASGVLLTAHWGAGHWLWRVLADAGIEAWFVARRAEVGDVGRGRVSRWYLRWRGWALKRVGAAGVVYTGGSRDELRATLARGASVVGMLDQPARGGHAVEVDFLGRPARLPTGLATLALECGAEVRFLACGLDPASGRRRLTIRRPPADVDAAAIVTAYAAWADALIAARPAAWHLWPLAPLYAATAPEPTADD